MYVSADPLPLPSPSPVLIPIDLPVSLKGQIYNTLHCAMGGEEAVRHGGWVFEVLTQWRTFPWSPPLPWPSCTGPCRGCLCGAHSGQRLRLVPCGAPNGLSPQMLDAMLWWPPEPTSASLSFSISPSGSFQRPRKSRRHRERCSGLSGLSLPHALPPRQPPLKSKLGEEAGFEAYRSLHSVSPP